MTGERRPATAPTPALLSTKFLPPVPGRGYVRRERLLRCMTQARSTPITLLSAPAGFGKTSLLAGWLSELEDPWAWLSIDRHDNDPGRLWGHLIAALQQLSPSIGGEALIELGRRSARGPIDRWLTPLINELTATTAPDSFLVLDDLHLLTDADQREAIGRMAAHLPGWLHLVISTRADPPLPLPRLRAAGRVTEVREADLRFMTAEATSLLAASGMDQLDTGQMELLVERTEGWAAGLQLASIALDRQVNDARLDDVMGSLRPFTDYLITEVVDQLDERMRTFLYATSVVDRVNPSLARALSGDLDSARLLREAEQQGLFLMALDGRDEWYRYHHLFSEALRHELKITDPEAADDANSAAARWFEEHGDPALALEHWLAAGRPDEALRLAVDVGFTLVDRGRAVTIESIARRIPASVPGSDPARQLDYGLLHLVFEPETFLAWVGQAAATMRRLDDPGPDLATRYLVVQSMADLGTGAWDDAFDHAVAAVKRGRAVGAPAGYSQRAQLQLIRAAGWLERVDEAERAFRVYVDDPSVPEPLRMMVVPAAWALASALAGRIDDADHWAQRSAAAGERGYYNAASAQELLLTDSIVARERGDRVLAATSIQALRSTDFEANFALRAVAEVELALVRIDEGRFDDAAEGLHAACRTRSGGPLGPVVVGRVDAAWSTLCLARGDVVGARRVAERMPAGLWKDVAVARCLLADGNADAADVVLRAVSASTPRQLVVVEMLRALSVVDRSPAAAREHAGVALDIATAAGMRQTLLTVGPGVADLIEKASWAVPVAWIERAQVALALSSAGPNGGRIARLVEQPTERERDAARFLASRLTVPEIAHELGVSPNTIKTHYKSLYRKLGVTSREEAVDVARELGILR